MQYLHIIENKTLRSSAIAFGGKNKNLIFAELNLQGKNPIDGLDTKAFQSQRDWVDGLVIRNSTISRFHSGVYFKSPIWSFNFLDNKLTKWSDFGFYLGQGGQFNRRSKDILIRGNHWFSPAIGVLSQPLMVLQSGSHDSVLNVKVINNIVEGAGGGYTRGVKNAAQGDQIVLQGVTNFLVQGNTISKGGENGLTVSRLSHIGVISDNNIFHNDQNAVNIGSGSYDISVDRVENFSAGDQILGKYSGARATVSYIDYGNILVLGQAGIAAFKQEPIINVTTGNHFPQPN